MGTGAAGEPAGRTRRWDGRAAVRSFLELFALAGLAITQPLLDVFGDAPEFFVFRDAGRAELIAFAVIVAVAPAAALWAVEQLIGLFGPRPRRAVHLVLLGLLVALFVMGAAKQADLATGVLLLAAGAAGAVLAVVAYRRWAAVQSWVRILAVAPLLFVGVFLLSSPAAALLDSQDIDAAAIAPVDDPRTVVVLQFDEWPTLTLVNGEGEIDPDIYPNLAALADDGAWYRNATTAATFTTYAVPSILTGRYPDGDRTAIASEYPENLFTLLGGQFDLDVIESVTRLCPDNLCDDELIDHPGRSDADVDVDVTTTTPPPTPTGPSTTDIVRQLLTDARQTFQALVSPDPDAAGPTQALSGSLDAATVVTTTTADAAPATTRGPTPEEAAADAATTTSTPADPGGPDTPTLPGFGGLGFADGALPILSIDSVDDLIGSIEAEQEPTLHFLHVLLPHSPYKFLPDGQQYTDNAEGLAGVMGNIVGSRGDEQAEVDLDHQRLLLQAAYTDAVIGRMTDRLKQDGLYDDAIIVVVADHGIGLQPGGVIRAAAGDGGLPPDNYADVLYVPLVIKAPGLEAGTVSDDNVSTVDIVPTIADELGIDLPWAVDGIALGRERRRSSQKETHVVGLGGGVGGPGMSVGPAVRFDGDDALDDMLARHVDTFLYADNPDHRLYAIHEAAEIVGERVNDLDLVDDAAATVAVDDLASYADIDLDAGELPAYVAGQIEANGETDLAVAIAVNGRIAAVTPTWPTDEQAHHFEAVLLPDHFRDGDNDVTLYLVGGQEGARTLAPLPTTTD